MKRYVKTFEEMIRSNDNEIPKEGEKKKKSKDKIVLDPDMQNPTAQGDDEETATARYPFGGI
jgi:hypothetical protein